MLSTDPISEASEKATRNVITQILPQLSENQILSVIKRMNKIIATGKPHDYAFVMATMRYKSELTVKRISDTKVVNG
jgi:hypothetical protein